MCVFTYIHISTPINFRFYEHRHRGATAVAVEPRTLPNASSGAWHVPCNSCDPLRCDDGATGATVRLGDPLGFQWVFGRENGDF